jgi:hypothetical protein
MDRLAAESAREPPVDRSLQAWKAAFASEAAQVS